MTGQKSKRVSSVVAGRLSALALCSDATMVSTPWASRPSYRSLWRRIGARRCDQAGGINTVSMRYTVALAVGTSAH